MCKSHVNSGSILLSTCHSTSCGITVQAKTSGWKNSKINIRFGTCALIVRRFSIFNTRHLCHHCYASKEMGKRTCVVCRIYSTKIWSELIVRYSQRKTRGFYVTIFQNELQIINRLTPNKKKTPKTPKKPAILFKRKFTLRYGIRERP